jgi:hypothetical protein
MAAYAFTTSDLALLRLWVKAGNHASARVAEKAGFLRSPELDDTIDVRGQPWTAHYYTLRRPSQDRPHHQRPPDERMRWEAQDSSQSPSIWRMAASTLRISTGTSRPSRRRSRGLSTVWRSEQST